MEEHIDRKGFQKKEIVGMNKHTEGSKNNKK